MPVGRWSRLDHTGNQTIQAGDEIDVQGAPDAVARVLDEQGLQRDGAVEVPEASLAGVLLTPRSRLIDQTLATSGFRERYGVHVLSVKRRGAPVDGPLTDLPLQFADALLVGGARHQIGRLRQEAGDFVVVSRVPKVAPDGPATAGQATAVAIVVAMMGLLTFELVPPSSRCSWRPWRWCSRSA